MPLEHINITVPNAKDTAVALIKLFGWHIRWEGASMDDGYSVHVGDEDSYLALYAPTKTLAPAPERYTQTGAMNHVGVVVDDIGGTEVKVKAAGFETYSHADYEPGKRFYFDGPDGIEFEVVQYD